MKLIDVSDIQTAIDWSRVADADAVIVRFSRGGDSDCCCGIAPETDDMAERNLRGCAVHRIACGVSHVLAGTTVSEVRREARWLIARLKENREQITLPVVAVFLGENGLAERYRQCSPAHNAELVRVFSGIIRSAGFIPVLHADRETLFRYVERTKIGHVGIWYVRPYVGEGTAMAEVPDMMLWQYSTESSPVNAGLYSDYKVSTSTKLNAVRRPARPRSIAERLCAC